MVVKLEHEPKSLDAILEDFLIPLTRHKEAKWEMALANTVGLEGKMSDLEAIIFEVMADNNTDQAIYLCEKAIAKAMERNIKREMFSGLAKWYSSKLGKVRKAQQLIKTVNTSTDVEDAEVVDDTEDLVAEMEAHLQAVEMLDGNPPVELTAEQAIREAIRQEESAVDEAIGAIA